MKDLDINIRDSLTLCISYLQVYTIHNINGLLASRQRIVTIVTRYKISLNWGNAIHFTHLSLKPCLIVQLSVATKFG